MCTVSHPKITHINRTGKATFRHSGPPSRMARVTSAQLSVDEKRTAQESILTLTGEIDMATAGELFAAAQRALLDPPNRVVLDFAGVTFCDSRGLSTLLLLNKAATAAGSSLVLVNVGDYLQRLLDITGLRAALTVEEPSA